MIPLQTRLVGYLSVAVLALVLQACKAPGGAIPSNPDTPAAKDAEAGALVPRVSEETSKPAEVGTAADAAAQVPAAGDSSTDPIAPGDLLKIQVAQADELSTEGRVAEGGSVQLPLIGAVHVGGLTPREAERRVAEILGEEFLQNPKVSIAVVE